MEKAIRRAKKEGKIAKTAQQTIPYEEMYPDGICRITNRLYSKSVLCDDINYAEASDDEKAVLFELYCKLVNYFGPSVGFELSVICYPADLVEYRKMLALNPQGDQFDEIRKEYSDMLVRQVSKSRYERRICLTYTIEADGIRQARSRLEQIDNDVVGHFRALTVAAHPMDGYERLTILHRCLHLEENRKFRFNWDSLKHTGLSSKDYIAPSSFFFKDGRYFRSGASFGAVSFLQIRATKLYDTLLNSILNMEGSQIVSIHAKALDQNAALKAVKRKLSDLDKAKIDEQKRAVRSGFDMDILPPDLVTFGKEAQKLLEDFYGKDAETAAKALGSKIVTREIPGLGETAVTGSAASWQALGEKLLQHGNSALFAHPEGETYEVQKVLEIADYIPIGMQVTDEGRTFTIDSVDYDFGSVSLRDDTFAAGTGFPVFRNEPVSYVRELVKDARDKELEELAASGAPLSEPSEPAAPVQPQPPKAENYRITAPDLGVGGPKAKYQANVAAIRLLKELEAGGRNATPEEQETLSRYVGWGGIPQAFDGSDEKWKTEYTELKGLLTPAEYEAARGSTLNAHYTAPVIIESIYHAVEQMGLEPKTMLEPAMGTGNFFGMVPDSMKDTALYGVELDSITGRIAKQLYPQAHITVDGFERVNFADNRFDLAVGNVPFGNYQIADARYDKQHFFIHDYFFGKTLDKVRPGGIVAFITSKGTRNLIETQLNGGSDAQIAQLQTRLNSAYDSFTAKWGLLNSTGNKRAFEQDSSYCLLCSLEVLDEDRNLERKRSCFPKCGKARCVSS